LVFAARGRSLNAWGTPWLVSRQCRSRWPRGQRRGSAAARWDYGFETHQGAWMSLSYENCVLSGTGLCVGLITRPEESCWGWCVQCVWSRSLIRGGKDTESGRSAKGGKIILLIFICPYKYDNKNYCNILCNASPWGWPLLWLKHVEV
jgi:hypothetical protein